LKKVLLGHPTLRIGFDPTQCACTHDMSNRLIIVSHLSIYIALFTEWALQKRSRL